MMELKTIPLTEVDVEMLTGGAVIIVRAVEEATGQEVIFQLIRTQLCSFERGGHICGVAVLANRHLEGLNSMASVHQEVGYKLFQGQPWEPGVGIPGRFHVKEIRQAIDCK